MRYASHFQFCIDPFFFTVGHVEGVWFKSFILIFRTGGCLEYWLHPLHLARGQASLRDADLEGHLLQDQEERVPHPQQDWTSGKKSDPAPPPARARQQTKCGRDPSRRLHDHGLPAFQAASVLPHHGPQV